MCVHGGMYIQREKTETDRGEPPDIAPIEGDQEARDQLCVETTFTKHKIRNTLKTRNHKELINFIGCTCKFVNVPYQ